MTEPSLDKEIAGCVQKWGDWTGVENYDLQIADLGSLVSSQVAKARIDERSQAQQYLHGLTITPENQHLFDVLSRNNHNRIATLNGVKNK